MNDIRDRTPDPSLTRNERIQIVMREYDTLRTEGLQRLTSWYQICGVAGTAVVAVAVIMAAYSVTVGLVLLVLFPIPISVMFKNLEFDMYELGNRLREVENSVNTLAEEKLLAWETERGGILPAQLG